MTDFIWGKTQTAKRLLILDRHKFTKSETQNLSLTNVAQNGIPINVQ